MKCKEEMISQYHIFHMILAGVFFTALVGLKLTMDCMRRVERQTLGRSSSFMVRQPVHKFGFTSGFTETDPWSIFKMETILVSFKIVRHKSLSPNFSPEMNGERVQTRVTICSSTVGHIIPAHQVKDNRSMSTQGYCSN